MPEREQLLRHRKGEKMQMNSLPENNSVVITGVVVEDGVFSHEVYGEGFYTFKISSERLSENADILPITVSERLLMNQNIVCGKHVKIKGQLRSYNNYTGNRSRLVLTIFVRDIQVLDEEQMHNENEIILNGFICKAPIYRKTPFGREISDVLIAVNRAYNKSDYIPCITWGRNARYISSLEVGTAVKVWGRIQSRVYQKKNGDQVEERIAYEVSVSKISLHTEENPPQVNATEEIRKEIASEIRNAFNFTKKILDTGECDMLMLDGILECVEEGYLLEEEVVEMMEKRPNTMDMILTGTSLPQSIAQKADHIFQIVTEK